MQDFDKLGVFYLGREWDAARRAPGDGLLLYDSRDLTTHAVCVGMTGSGKTGLCIGLIEEAAIDGIPAIVIDPKGDLANLMLQFPDLAPQDFAPWVDPEAARRQNVAPEEFARREAEKWRNGLAEWGQDGERIRRLQEAAEFAVYTPGSSAGRPVSILRSFAAPAPAWREDTDLVRERAGSTVTALLGLLGIDADPLRSREHILLSTILLDAWGRGSDVELATLVHAVQSPPVQQIGVMELETFYPQKDRAALALALNNLLAAPGFQAWMGGEPLDPAVLLHTATGKPRVAIFSIAHLADPERMFFVSLLLNQTIAWMRTQSGTSSLRALLYMDEIFGYFPPTANPPSKPPLLQLLKTARAFGLGVVLATQNPVDLDYKGLANTGTWFIGKLQTERDRARLLDGLEAAGGGLDRAALEQLLDALGSRVFLLHDVHAAGPRLFQTRWTMSYLRGPMTRDELKRLRRTESMTDAGMTAAGAAPAAPTPTMTPSMTKGTSHSAPPVLPPDIPTTVLDPTADAPAGATLEYVPQLLGQAALRFAAARPPIDVARDVHVLAPIPTTTGAAAWGDATLLDGPPAGRDTAPSPSATAFGALPAEASQARSYTRWKRELADWLARSQEVRILRSTDPAVVSNPDEPEREFRIRLGEIWRAQRDARAEALRAKYAPKVARLEERLRRAEHAHERERDQLEQQKVQGAISIGATILGAFLGSGKRGSVGRATTAARGVSRTRKEAADVDRAGENLESASESLRSLQAEFEAELAALDTRFDPATAPLETVTVRPKKAAVAVQAIQLAWAPVWRLPDGTIRSGWR